MGALMPWHLIVTAIAMIVFSLVGALVARLALDSTRTLAKIEAKRGPTRRVR